METPKQMQAGDTKPRRQFGERRRTERKIPLEIVEQAKVERLFAHLVQNPVRCARLVKKMPLGACAANSPILPKLAVS